MSKFAWIDLFWTINFQYSFCALFRYHKASFKLFSRLINVYPPKYSQTKHSYTVSTFTSNTWLIDSQYQRDPYTDDDIPNQAKFELKHNFDGAPEQSEDDDIITDSHVSDKRRNELIHLRTVIPQLPNTSPMPNFRPSASFKKCQKLLIEKKINPQLQSIPGKNTKIQPLSANLQLKNKKDAIFLDGFCKINNWLPHRYKFINKCHFGSRRTKNPIASTANNFKRWTTRGLSNNGSEWTVRKAKRKSWTSFRS